MLTVAMPVNIGCASHTRSHAEQRENGRRPVEMSEEGKISSSDDGTSETCARVSGVSTGARWLSSPKVVGESVDDDGSTQDGVAAVEGELAVHVEEGVVRDDVAHVADVPPCLLASAVCDPVGIEVSGGGSTVGSSEVSPSMDVDAVKRRSGQPRASVVVAKRKSSDRKFAAPELVGGCGSGSGGWRRRGRSVVVDAAGVVWRRLRRQFPNGEPDGVLSTLGGK